MPEDFHIDMSGKLHKHKTVGIACVSSSKEREHNGCVLKSNLVKLLQTKLVTSEPRKGNAKIYAICIYLLIKDKISDIQRLVICNDEEFTYVKSYLNSLIGPEPKLEIISISDLRKLTGRKFKSFADNHANHYRKRGLNSRRRTEGINLNVVEVNYSIILDYWNRLG